MAKGKEPAKSHSFHLNLSQISGSLNLQESELKESTEKEYAKLSITPRTFVEREYIKYDESSLLAIIKSQMSSVKSRFNSLAVDSLDAPKLAQELQNIELITQGKATRILNLNKRDVAKAKTQLQEIAKVEVDKLALGIKAFEESKDLASIITIDHYMNLQKKEVLKYGMHITNDLIVNIDNFNSLVALKISGMDSCGAGSSSNKRSSSKSRVSEDTNKFIHFIELCLITKALSEVGDNKPILVEVFARHDDGKIKFDHSSPEKIPEIHTILLYKMPQSQEVLILDPNNSEFTRHLVLGHNKKLIEEGTKSQSSNGYELVAPAKKLQIYQAIKETGSKITDGRDCVDIAVKLAFEIIDGEPLLNIIDMLEWSPVVNITNRKVIDESIITEKDIALRIKQSSDDSIRVKFQKCTKTVLKLIKMTRVSEDDRIYRSSIKHEEKLKDFLCSPEKGGNDSYEILLQNTHGSDSLYSIYVGLVGEMESFFQKDAQSIIDTLT